MVQRGSRRARTPLKNRNKDNNQLHSFNKCNIASKYNDSIRSIPKTPNYFTHSSYWVACLCLWGLRNIRNMYNTNSPKLWIEGTMGLPLQAMQLLREIFGWPSYAARLSVRARRWTRAPALLGEYRRLLRHRPRPSASGTHIIPYPPLKTMEELVSNLYLYIYIYRLYGHGVDMSLFGPGGSDVNATEMSTWYPSIYSRTYFCYYTNGNSQRCCFRVVAGGHLWEEK